VSQLIVLRASDEEAAAHEKLLNGIEKAAKQVPVWRRTENAAG
jgi:hypothetical protein